MNAPSLSIILIFLALAAGRAEEMPAFSTFQLLTNQEMRLQLSGPKAVSYRVDMTDDLETWQPLIALTNATGTVEHIDSASPYRPHRYYRAEQLTGSTLTGDYLQTGDGDVLIHPVFHATMLLKWKDTVICVDPTANTVAQLRSLPEADIVLVTHEHSDHFNSSAISTVARSNASILVSRSVFPLLTTALRAVASMMTNDTEVEVGGIRIQAIPAYNRNHAKGNGNGYLLRIGGKNLYISGDTDDIPEMRALQDIDVAFVCMDGTFNMGMTQAANAVREFRPKIVFPYHYNSQNPATFKRLVGTEAGVEVRLRKWE